MKTYLLFSISLLFLGTQAIAQSNIPNRLPNTLPPADDFQLDFGIQKAANQNNQAKETLKALSQSNNSFALNFYRILAQDQKSANLCFSPLSISTTFWMTYSGARKLTEKEIARSMSLPLSARKVEINYLEFTKQLKANITEKQTPAPPNQLGVRFANANSLFLVRDNLFSNQFKNTLQKQYQAPTYLLRQKEQIDTWVKTQTQEQIPEFLQQLNLNELAAKNINALSAKAPWEKDFFAKDIQEGDFMAFNWRKVPTTFLKQTQQHKLISNLNYQLISLPFKNSHLTLQILLPSKNIPLSKLEQSLTQKQFNQWQETLQKTPLSLVELSIPQLELNAKTPLRQNLQELGMKRIFIRGKADLSGMESTPGGIYFGEEINNESSLSIQKEGINFAATTAVSFQEKKSTTPINQEAAPDEAIIAQFNANRPFLYWVTESKSNTLLLLGRYQRPDEELKEENQQP